MCTRTRGDQLRFFKNTNRAVQLILVNLKYVFYQVTLESGVPTSFMLQLKNVREVNCSKNCSERTGVVLTQVSKKQ